MKYVKNNMLVLILIAVLIAIISSAITVAVVKSDPESAPEWLSAIGTLLAVIVSLYLSTKKESKAPLIFLTKETLQKCEDKSIKIWITVTNLGQEAFVGDQLIINFGKKLGKYKFQVGHVTDGKVISNEPYIIKPYESSVLTGVFMPELSTDNWNIEFENNNSYVTIPFEIEMNDFRNFRHSQYFKNGQPKTLKG
ncbi:MAG: hypothetical protein ACRC9Z_10395 [Weissella confusa]